MSIGRFISSFGQTCDVLAQTTEADDLRGIVPTYADLYTSVPCSFEDLNQQQVEELLQLQIDARNRVFLQLPGAIDDNRTAIRFEGDLYRVVGSQKRRGKGRMQTFTVLLLKRWNP